MELKLMQLRKQKGFRTRAAFAGELGISERKLKAWETGETRIYFDDVIRIADALDCSVDELAGRRNPGTLDDERSHALIRDYQRLSDLAKNYAAASVHGMAELEDFGRRNAPEANSPEYRTVPFEGGAASPAHPGTH